MNRMNSLLRLVVLTAVGLLSLLFLPVPVFADGELPVVVHEAHPAAAGKAAVRFRSFNAPGGKDVYFGATNGAAEVPTATMSQLDWVNEAAWGARNPFVITYSALTGELAVSITVETAHGGRTTGTAITYSGVSVVGDLGELDYVQWTIANLAKQQQVTSAMVGVENLAVNGVVLGSYVIEEGSAPVVLNFALEQVDLAAELTITGEIVQSGNHSAAPDANMVEFVLGRANPVDDESGDEAANDENVKDENANREDANDGAGEPGGGEAGEEDAGDSNGHVDGGENGEGGDSEAGDSEKNVDDGSAVEDGENAGEQRGDNEGGVDERENDTGGGENAGGGNEGDANEDESNAGDHQDGSQDGSQEGNDGAVDDVDNQPGDETGDPSAEQTDGADPKQAEIPAEPEDGITTPAVDPVEEPVDGTLDQTPDIDAPQQPDGFRLYLPTTMQVATMIVR